MQKFTDFLYKCFLLQFFYCMPVWCWNSVTGQNLILFSLHFTDCYVSAFFGITLYHYQNLIFDVEIIYVKVFEIRKKSTKVLTLDLFQDFKTLMEHIGGTCFPTSDRCSIFYSCSLVAQCKTAIH